MDDVPGVQERHARRDLHGRRQHRHDVGGAAGLAAEPASYDGILPGSQCTVGAQSVAHHTGKHHEMLSCNLFALCTRFWHTQHVHAVSHQRREACNVEPS